MNIREITSGIYYTGVNDRVTDKFEGMWPLPYGVSYNAYLVRGSKGTALMDTVEITEVHEYLDAVERTLQGSTPDYLVVHHMEPDHSGSIPEVVRRWPDLKIVGNAQTVGMIKGFYHVDDDSRFVTVKDGVLGRRFRVLRRAERRSDRYGDGHNRILGRDVPLLQQHRG